jgi:hypothetical protein
MTGLCAEYPHDKSAGNVRCHLTQKAIIVWRNFTNHYIVNIEWNVKARGALYTGYIPRRDLVGGESARPGLVCNDPRREYPFFLDCVPPSRLEFLMAYASFLS